MKWARRQHQTRRQPKSLKTTLFAVLVSVVLITSILVPFASQTASAASIPTTSAISTPNVAVVAADTTPSIDPCNATGVNLSWVVCPVINMISGATMGMQNIINHLMMVDVTGTFCTSNADKNCKDSDIKSGTAYYTAWNSFRVFGIALIIIAGLVMVISQALGMEIFDAYTVKKVLPRMLIAVIGISLSWWLMKFLVELTNDLGIGIRSVIYYPFKSLIEQGTGIQSLGSSLLETMIGAGAFFFLQIGGVLSLIATAALAALVAFLVLILRQIIITFLILLAPLAIACYVLPNTEKAYKLWWDSLSKGLMMFPIISAFIAAGQVFAVVAASNTNTNFGVSNVVAILAYFLPYFALPFTFRLAGGALATLGGLTNDRSRGVFDGLKNYRKGKVAKRNHYLQEHYGDRYLKQGKASIVRGLNAQASKRGRVGGALLRGAARQVEGIDNMEAVMSALTAERSKQLNDQIATGVDSEIRGLTVDRSMGWDRAVSQGLARTQNGARQWKSLGGAWVDESDVINGQKRWGHDVAAQQAALSYEMRKVNTEEDAQSVTQRYRDLAKNQWHMTDTQAGGAWIGASFENQGQHLEYKYSKWDAGQPGGVAALKTGGKNGIAGGDFVDEIYEKRGSYNMAQMGSNTIEQLKAAHGAAQQVLDTAGASAEQRAAAQDQQQKLAAIAETFMNQYGGVGGDEENLAAMQAEAEGRAAAGRVPVRQSNTPGAAHVAERVRELASITGVYGQAPSGFYGPGHQPNTPDPNRREQN